MENMKFYKTNWIYSFVIIIEGIIVLIASNILNLKNKQKMIKEEQE